MKNGLHKKVWVYGIIILFIGASIIPDIVGGSYEYFYATQDVPVSNDGITGSYTDTHLSDDQYEAIKEKTNGGKPQNRFSFLEHKWRFELTGSYTSLNFYLEAYHTANSEGDDFIFAYSINDLNYYELVTVTKTSDDDMYQTASLPSDLTGTVYIRVKDLDQTAGNKIQDMIHIDHMYIEATSGPDVTPPVISEVSSDVNENTWYYMSPTAIGGIFDERERHAMAHYASVNRTILFSGKRKPGVPEINDTWAYNYSTNIWYNMTPGFVGGSLSEREDFSLVYDSIAERIILFGGSNGAVDYYNDTWVYNYTDNKWYNKTPTISYENGTLKGGNQYSIAYDSHADRTILLGGYNGAVWTNETWEYNYNTNTWTNLTPSMTTSGGSFIALLKGQLVYDSQADRCILFGGQNINGRLNETWEYNYNTNTWTNLTPSMTTIGGWLEPRDWHRMVYDSHADRTIMFSGNRGTNDHINDTWTYNYTTNTWCNVSYTTNGSGTLWPREASAMAYDSTNKRTILMGGYCNPEPVNDMLDDTWVFIDELTAMIIWATDELSDSVVRYGTTTALGNTSSDSNMITSHEIILTDLLPDTTYYYEVQSTDASNNTAIDNNNGSYYTFYTGEDTTPPIISNVASSDITHNSAKITWDTDEPSNSIVKYGTTTPPSSTKSDSSMVTSHSITLTDLLPETTYYYEVQSTDQDGNTGTDNNNGSYYTFTTESAPNNTMHVYSIDMWYEQTGVNYMIYTKVKIVDQSDNPVNNAMVYIETTLPDSSKVSDNDVTDGDGFVTFSYGKTKDTGTYTSTVTNVVKEGWTYNPDDNVETSEQLDVP